MFHVVGAREEEPFSSFVSGKRRNKNLFLELMVLIPPAGAGAMQFSNNDVSVTVSVTFSYTSSARV